ncbi:MAG TPA: SIMPL domain-containing protein [Chloroflexota bacterium]|nr:SIMPL domain-containing protein [Chloroflexota bacterium]
MLAHVDMDTLHAMPRDVTVSGVGRAASLPDRADLTVGIEREATTREQAYSQTAEASASVDQVISRFASALDRATTTSLSVLPRRQHRDGESVQTGWISSRSMILDVTDFTHMSELVRELTAAGASVSGLAWRLDPDNEAYSEARRLAASDALRRSADYARALDLTLGSVLWIAEPGLRDSANEPRRVGRPMAASAWAGGDEQVVGVQPEEIAVSATVELAMELLDSQP